MTWIEVMVSTFSLLLAGASLRYLVIWLPGAIEKAQQTIRDEEIRRFCERVERNKAKTKIRNSILY